MENKKSDKILKINYVGFWADLNPDNNFFTNILKRRYTVEISDDPDYLFCSVFSHEFVKYKNCIRIFYSGESQTPDFNLFDYGMSFDYMDFSDRYFRLPIYLLYGTDLLEMAEKRAGMRKNPGYRDDFCSFVYSNNRADPLREEFFDKLSKYKTVDSGGRYLNNVGGPVTDKVDFESKHRFSVAFENSSYPGYMSEKIFQSFAAGTIPIYWGDTMAGSVINKKAFIDVNSFKDQNEAVEYVRYIDSNPDKFFSMLQEPVFSNGYDPKMHLKKAEEFLFHIFDQEKEKAYRRNRTFRGNNYELFFRRYGYINDSIRRIRRLF